MTYAVEIQPRPWLPIALVENRIARDLVTNLEAVAVEAAVRYRDQVRRNVTAIEVAVDSMAASGA